MKKDSYDDTLFEDKKIYNRNDMSETAIKKISV